MASPNLTEQYRQQLLAAFPPKPFHGFLTRHGDCCDDGRRLVKQFTGRAWPEISHYELFHNSNSICLLEPDALIAFLPAWLLRAIEITLQESASLRRGSTDFTLVEYTLYFLCPQTPEKGFLEGSITEIIYFFDTAQRKAVATLLQTVQQCPETADLVEEASFGLLWWPPTS